MDDAFAFVAPVMPKRRVDPFALKAAAISTVFVAMVGAFGAFVVDHERAADARAEATVRVYQATDLTASVDGQARDALQAATAIATDAFARTSSYTNAGIGRLTDAEPDLLFVDGPSQSPGVVSIVATDSVWAAAVRSDSGCRWIVLASSGPARRGIGDTCTGRDAMAALLG